MRHGFPCALLVLACTAGLSLAQAPPAGPSEAMPGNPPPNFASGGQANSQAGFGGVDFLFWWIKGDKLPPLVTAGPAGSGAVLGQNGVVPLFGGSSPDPENRVGGRFTLGYWLDSDQSLGLEGSFFFLDTRAIHFLAGGTGAPGTPVIGRPFFNVNTNAPDAQLVASPGLLAGTVGVKEPSQLLGAELNVVAKLFCEDGFRVDVLAGFRYLHLGEGLDVVENLQILPGVPQTGGNQFGVVDQFGTSNYFYGGQVGVKAEMTRGNLVASVVGKLALGETQEIIQINGLTQFLPAGGTASSAAGGLLAQSSNIGRHSVNRFAVVPELGLTAAYQVTSQWRVLVGYSFLYISDVARPGSEINLAVNPTHIPANTPLTQFGPIQPLFVHHDTDFWAQGINVGFEFRF